MTDWAARAKAHFLQKTGEATAKTPEILETRLLVVMGAPTQPANEITYDLDDRVVCTDCRHLKPGNRCLNRHRAALSTRELAADFTQLRQRCNGFAAKNTTPLRASPN